MCRSRVLQREQCGAEGGDAEDNVSGDNDQRRNCQRMQLEGNVHLPARASQRRLIGDRSRVAAALTGSAAILDDVQMLDAGHNVFVLRFFAIELYIETQLIHRICVTQCIFVADLTGLI